MCGLLLGSGVAELCWYEKMAWNNSVFHAIRKNKNADYVKNGVRIQIL